MPYSSLLELEEWMTFRRRVTETYPNFFIELSKAHSDLTKHQIKLCALLLFECEDAEIVKRLEMNSIEALLTAKSRLRKKFKLKDGESLHARLLLIAAGNYVPPPSGKLSASIAH